MDLNINWEAVRIASMTVVRREWTVKALEKLARRGDDTPVSGKALI